MKTRNFALYGGILMLILGVVALIPGLEGSAASLPALKVNTSYGDFFGVFPMNIFNKLALITFGVAGIAVSRADLFGPSVKYAKVVFGVMGVLAVLGLIPATSTLGGYLPLFDGEVASHGIFALIAIGCVMMDKKVARSHLPPERKYAQV